MTKKFLLNTDGASRGNPGLAAVGFIIRDETGTILIREGAAIGTATNNEAEYSAVKMAFEKLIREFRSDLPAFVEVRADSLLIVKQLGGEYKIKNPRLKVLLDQVKILEMEVGRVVYTAVPRAENSLADEQANLALDRELE